MQVLFIEARKKFKQEDIDLSLLNNFKNKTISLSATIQYIGLISEIKKHLELNKNKVITKRGAKHIGHILGCNSNAIDKSADEILILTDGKFHAINNAIQIQKPIHIFSGKSLDKITKQEIEEHNKKTQIKQKKFLASKKVGFLVSTKYGQKNNQVEKIKKQIEKLDKKVYIFETNNINTAEFENFPQIQIWVNTACFGLARDHKDIINLQDITQFLKVN